MKPKFVLIIFLIFVAFRTYGQTKADDIIGTWVTGGKEPANTKALPIQSRGPLCPGLDSNQHAVSSTTTSKWLVYQFQHLGILIGSQI